MSNDARDSRRRGTAGLGSVGIAAEISRLIVASSSNGLVAVDDQGTIRLCNQAAEELLARPASELIGTQFGFPVVGGRGTEVELMLPGGGERVVEMRVITTLVEDERLHITALRDITRRRHAERELKAALEHQNIVVAITAHELHTPLAAIGMLAHVLRDQRAELTPTEQEQSIERIISYASS
jgi:PAS domain-containing protein